MLLLFFVVLMVRSTCLFIEPYEKKAGIVSPLKKNESRNIFLSTSGKTTENRKKKSSSLSKAQDVIPIIEPIPLCLLGQRKRKERKEREKSVLEHFFLSIF